MWAHFQETVSLGNFKTLTYLSFLMAEMWEAAERGNQEELLSLLSLGLVFCEQAANEQGHTRLAWLLTCREDPPFAVVEQRKAPRAEVPHGMPADPRWIATQLDYLRDVETIQGSHHQLLGSRPRHAERERAPRRQEPAGTSFGFRWVCDCFSALYTPPEIFGQLPHPVIELHCKVFSSIIFELCLAKLHHTVAVLHS